MKGKFHFCSKWRGRCYTAWAKDKWGFKIPQSTHFSFFRYDKMEMYFKAIRHSILQLKGKKFIRFIKQQSYNGYNSLYEPGIISKQSYFLLPSLFLYLLASQLSNIIRAHFWWQRAKVWFLLLKVIILHAKLAFLNLLGRDNLAISPAATLQLHALRQET